ncbi:MAG: hypothetical protein IJ455_03835 [Agathobacter sp.]|nr:hypothetical protein [Agathobacter sp.]
MSNEKIEKMLYDAQEKLPTTNLEWRISDMVEKKKIRMNKVVAACIAFVMFLGIGGGTALANMEMDIDANNYSQWVDVRSEGNWNACEKLMEKRGFVIPENFGDYKYDRYRTLLVAQKGDTYLDALTKNVYNPINIEYDDVPSKQYDENGYLVNVEGDDGQWINVSIGTLDEAYWSAYYEFENIDGTWIYAETERTFEYEGMTIYGKVHHFESGDNMNWRWVDEKTGVCWCVNVPVDSEIDSLEVVKTIIDLNK